VKIGGWRIDPALDFCLLREDPESADREFLIFLQIDGSIGIAMTDSGWTMRRGEEIELLLEAGSQRFEHVGATTIQPSAFLHGFRAKIDDAVLNALARAPELVVTIAGQPERRIDMTDSARALASARSCRERVRLAYAALPKAPPAPPPAPLAPPPLPRVGPAHARLQSGYFSDEDYPARAWQQKASGISRVLIDVSAEGDVADCKLIESSGNVELDFAACRVIEDRFHFYPALDEASRPVPDQIRQGIRWQFPAEDYPGVAPPPRLPN
jgi:TonB family protein